ncbi:beta-galactosidase/beta-glucuronidase [Breznakibacter xylanolyticus]|uniref:Beta-galactosidase n=1 Tax=Breznakibacter xylanolyticus TaxID=990 RepID=A0A2W7NZI7_9BACT|nr:glycoside hydrolase family 2 TIM barrel-domain containing protein [Breznakibacter xylanolyticus]PZX18646.1 beta-galactosidase/beta-glucuronidase [Breznakibacter xylanolyticus]
MKHIIASLSILLSMALQAQSTTEVVYLSGRDNRSTVEWDFFCSAGRNSGQWHKIVVPSCWEQQGFGCYDFGRAYFTNGDNFRFADETGIYKTSFEVPKSWGNKRVQIVFDGVMTDARVTINGVMAGDTHQGAFYQFRYDITDKIKTGINTLEVAVSKMSDNHSVNRAERYADYWIFGGIHRPVYLEVLPQEFIQRMAIAAEADGSFHARVYPGNVAAERQVVVRIRDHQGQLVGESMASVPAGAQVVDVKGMVKNPRLWSAETPNLYRAEVSLLARGKTLHSLNETIGFRTIEVRPRDGIYVNGTKVKMKGINRHVFWPETGRTVNADVDLMDVKLIKEMNMNAVRCSHYPPGKDFLNICDSLGLYVIDELAGWQDAYDTPVGRKLVKEMIAHDVNHPSIIFWSNGNEGGHNRELEPDYQLWDHSSRVLIRAHHRPGNELNGIDCNHYEDYYSTRAILEKGDNVYMPTEFLHCQDDGGGGAGLRDFWELMWQSPMSGGGFLWVFADEAVVRTDMHNHIDVNGVNANDGVVGPHRQKEGSFYAIREIFTPVKINMSKLPAPFNGTVAVENRYHFTNLNQCRFVVELVNFQHPDSRLSGSLVMKTHTVASPDVAPVAHGELNLNLPADWPSYDAIRLKSYDPRGMLVAEWTWKTRETLAMVMPSQTRVAKPGVAFGDSAGYVSLKAAGMALIISKATGLLEKIDTDWDYDLQFGNGPIPAGGQAVLKKLTHFADGDNHVVETTFDGVLQSARWTMMPNGWVKLDYQYSQNDSALFAGISFTYPESNAMYAKWLGKGPVRVWKNRTTGGTLDVWQSIYNNTQTGSAPWIYPEFKGYFADVAWMELSTAEGKVLVVAEQDDLYVRLFDFYALTDKNPHPSLPAGNLSFLDAIPPIGTKMATGLSRKTERLGPDSERNAPLGTVKRTLWFYFGERPADK